MQCAQLVLKDLFQVHSRILSLWNSCRFGVFIPIVSIQRKIYGGECLIVNIFALPFPVGSNTHKLYFGTYHDAIKL
jgi:hypothetical protein